MAATQLEIRLLVRNCEHVNVATCVLVERHRLQQDVLAALFRLLDVDQFEKRLTFLENVRVALLTDLTFKLLPVVACHVLAVLFNVPLRLKPAFEALIVNQADRSGTLARQDQRVVFSLLRTPTEATLNLILSCNFTKRNQGAQSRN